MGRVQIRRNKINSSGFLDQFGRPMANALSQPYRSGDPTSRLLNDLPYANYNSDQTIRQNLQFLRGRARFLERNNDIVRRAVHLVINNTVGPTGIRFQSAAIKARGDDDKEARQKIETDFKEWSRQPTADGQMTMREAQALVERRKFIDGEVFIEELPGFAKNDFRYAFRILEGDSVDSGYTDPAKRIYFGIQYDRDWRPLRYYVIDSDDIQIRRQGKIKYRIVAAERMLHYFERERANQKRGVPQIASPTQRLHMLDQFEEATLVGARVASSKMGFFRDTDEAETSYTGTDELEDQEEGKEHEIQDQFVEIAPGQFEDIGSKEFTSFDPGYPPAGYDEYVTSILRSISSGLNISYHKLANDLRDVNYSTAREAKLDDVDAWRMRQGALIDHFIDPVFRGWLGIQILRPGYSKFNPAELPRLAKARWQPRGWQWIDPQKEANGNMLAIQLGVKSPSDVAADQGKDFEEVIKQTARDKEIAEEYGIDIGNVFTAQAINSQPDEPRRSSQA